MTEKLLFALLAIALVSTTAIAAEDDDCEEIGKLVAMMTYGKEHCPSFELSSNGETALVNLYARVGLLGGSTCMDKGGRAMMEQLPIHSGELLRALASGNQARVEQALCIAIPRYLRKVSPLIMAPGN